MWLVILFFFLSGTFATNSSTQARFSTFNNTETYENSTSAQRNISNPHSLTISDSPTSNFTSIPNFTAKTLQDTSIASDSVLSSVLSSNSTPSVGIYNISTAAHKVQATSTISIHTYNSTRTRNETSIPSEFGSSQNNTFVPNLRLSNFTNSTNISHSPINATSTKNLSSIPLESTIIKSTFHQNSTNTTATESLVIVSSSPTSPYQNTTTSTTFRFHRLNAAVATTSSLPKPKDVFAHYLVGTVTADHANKDIDEAMAMGLDGFALNIGDPSAEFLQVSLDNLFGYAEYVGFKLFISMDVYASGNSCHNGREGACGGPIAYESILKGRLGSSAWYKGPNGLPMISSYSSGGKTSDVWDQWKTDFASTMYFIPDFDETSGYYETDLGWYAYWGDMVDGLFSWESAWPYRSGFGGQSPGDISPDLPVQSEMAKHNKGYMMPLSTLQYKNAYGANVYRAGDLNLPIRMEKILAMDSPPDFVQVITWNDGPEGHYIGNLWLEQNNDTAPMMYANQIDFPHNAWQPLITSFINAYKNGDQASEMAPPPNSVGIGAMWYTTILQSAVCPSAPNPLLYNASKPDGFETGSDQLNWAIVVPAEATGYSIRANSNNDLSELISLKPGLNYGSFPVKSAGFQRIEVYKHDYIILVAGGGRCISDGCPDCIYNMNPQVIGFHEGDNGYLGTCPYQNCQKKVFAHYMIGNLYEDHVHQDIDDAARLGLDGFALNVGDPTQSFVRQTFNYMFDYVRDNHPNFKLFISMDLWAEGNAFQGVQINKYHDLLRDFLGHSAWLLGPNGHPFVSTYSSGGLNHSNWTDWKAEWGNALYFVPDIDDTAGYNTSDPGWWDYWGDIIDGVMSWETTWPKPGLEQAGDISVDEVIVQGTYKHRKAYMMPLSALQYKNAYDTNYYRQGDLNLPTRMEKILSMPITPDFVQYLTWNDGPESHYIGNLWSEQNNDTQPGLYANQEDWSHTGWQPLLSSFITAFKAGLPASSMTVPNNEVAVGALWYKTVLQSTTCPVDEGGSSSDNQYSVKPNGFEAGTDQLNWAVVLPPSSNGMSIRAISDGQIISTVEVGPGLNYGFASDINTGQQRLELIDSSGAVVLAAAGGRCIATNCPDCIYNMNQQVVPLIADTGAIGPCPDQHCIPHGNPDGTCASYTVADGDTCASIASNYHLSTDQIESYNTETWGWYGCDDLPFGLRMCLSIGKPPLPVTLDNAVCGPQVPGTQQPTDGTSLADLNPCPLNACCNIHGQCGIDSDFCLVYTSETGNPGTTRSGKNSCISNCGITMISGDPPKTFRKITYFEGFNQERDCLYADFSDINFDNYTAVHFAFAAITEDFKVDLSAVQDQFDLFKKPGDYNRVLSFGGWSFTTSQDSSPIFRQGVSADNRATFISSVVNIVKSAALDGVDFDWEYPGASNIPGVADGNSEDGANYLSFLKSLKAALPSGVTLSIAVPASYNLLKNFPIKEMSKVVDYIIYMTYDLHGQWEYGQPSLNSGCPGGSCLRSHVNSTETANAITMITKAGVPSSKVVVGLSSFGRSFEMSDPSCYHASCTYTGPDSGAIPGSCTQKAGYLSLSEIQYIINNDDSAQTIGDGSSNAWILIYNDNQWVSYIDDFTKFVRTEGYQVGNLGGTADWAIDLNLNIDNDNIYVEVPDLPSCEDIDTYSTLDDIIADTSIPDNCVSKYVVPILSTTLDAALSNYTDVMDDKYDSKFKAYAGQVRTIAKSHMSSFVQEHLSDQFTCIYELRDGKGGHNNKTGDCPPKGDIPNYTSTYYIIPNDIEAFYQYMDDTYGIDRSWIEFYKYTDNLGCGHTGCESSITIVDEPHIIDGFDVPNPKDLISASLSNLTAFNDYLRNVGWATDMDLWDGLTSDVVDGASLPVFMIQSSVNAMQQVADIGEKVEEAKKKELILLFLSAIFLILPGLGEIVDAAFDIAAFTRIVTLASEAGNAGISISDAVHDPANAPAAIFGILLGGAALRSEKAFGDAASARRAMSDSEIANFGDDLSTSMSKVSKLDKTCG